MGEKMEAAGKRYRGIDLAKRTLEVCMVTGGKGRGWLETLWEWLETLWEWLETLWEWLESLREWLETLWEWLETLREWRNMAPDFQTG